MKIELKKERTMIGDVFYRIAINDDVKESFFAGNIADMKFDEKDKQANEKATLLYDQLVAFGSDISEITILKSAEI